MSENAVRLRVRISSAKARSVGASISTVEIPVENLAVWNTDNFLATIVNKQVAKEINKALSIKFSFTKTKFSGKKLLLEFICNPNDPEQLKLLSKFLKGNLGILRHFVDMGIKLNSFPDHVEVSEAAASIQSVSENTANTLNGQSGFAGTNQYEGTSSNVTLQLPIVYKEEKINEKTHNTYQSLNNDGEVLHVYQYKEKSKERFINLPFAGSLRNKDKQTTNYVVAKEHADGTGSNPVLLYQQYDGFVNGKVASARGIVRDVNDILQYVGTGGDGVNAANTVSVNDAFPSYIVNEQGDKIKASGTYKSVVTNFNLMINGNGLQEIIFAPARAVMKAYFNIMRKKYSEVFEKAGDLFFVTEDGRVMYNKQAAESRFDYEDVTPLNAMRRLAATATKLIADLFSVRSAGTSQSQAERFSKLTSGKGKSGLNTSDFLKVVVQMVDPSDVSAYFEVNSRNKKTGKYNNSSQFFNNGKGNFDSTVSEVNEAQNRFADPAELTD